MADKTAREIWTIGALTLGVVLTGSSAAIAQNAPERRVLVDAAAMTDRDPTDFYYGSPSGMAGRVAVGVLLSEHNGIRFEADVPRWRSTDTDSFSQIFCAPATGCVGGPGSVPAHTTTHDTVRTVSYTLLYAGHLPPSGRVQVSLLAGGAVEKRAHESSGMVDELAADGRVVRHTTFETASNRDWFAAVLGMDVEIRLTSHLAVTPQFRFHTWPYPKVSIVRPGVAVRWRF